MVDEVMDDDKVQTVVRLRKRVEELERENHRLTELLGLNAAPPSQVQDVAGTMRSHEEPFSFQINRTSSPELKIALFESLFVGRRDVYALRWVSSKTGKSGWSPAVVGGAINARSRDRELLPLTPSVIGDHLSGRIQVGLYPLLPDDTCRLVACDFDGPSWTLDAIAYFDAARSLGIDPALERSRSGDGAHVWIFFREDVTSTLARRLGTIVLREAMNRRGDMDLASYDRLFPAQDFMPKGSFGNLIALPLQRECRDRGTTVFMDTASLKPLDDQWAYLSSLHRLSKSDVEAIVSAAPVVAAGPEEATFRRTHEESVLNMPESVEGVSGAMLGIQRSVRFPRESGHGFYAAMRVAAVNDNS